MSDEPSCEPRKYEALELRSGQAWVLADEALVECRLGLFDESRQHLAKAADLAVGLHHNALAGHLAEVQRELDSCLPGTGSSTAS